MDEICWKVCFSQYDREDFIPLTLPDWGHALWQQCLMQISARARDFYGNCPEWRKLIRNEPQPNYSLMDVLDLQISEKETILRIGRVPNFIDSSILKNNFLERFNSAPNIISIKYEDDTDSICEEKIVSVTYKGDWRSQVLKELSNKILSVSTEEFHWMINIIRSDNKYLDKIVKDIFSNYNFDLVMVYPNKPVLGFNISILGDVRLIKNHKPLFKDKLPSMVKASSVVISMKHINKAYWILYFIEQSDLLEASELLSKNGIVFDDESYPLKNVGNSICSFEIKD